MGDELTSSVKILFFVLLFANQHPFVVALFFTRISVNQRLFDDLLQLDEP